MAESYTPRMGVRRWTDNGDTFTRDELDLSFVNIEARAAIFGNGTLAARPAAGVQGRFYLLDSTEPDAAQRGQLYYDTGTAWIMVKFDLTATLATKANVSHSHAIADLPAANNGEVSSTKFVKADDARLSSEWEPGDILWSAATTRTGFVKADGAQYNTTDLPGLFAKIGYTFGGSAGVFNVPNASDRFLVGSLTGTKNLGAVGGSATKVIAATNIPPHAHDMQHTHSINHDHAAFTSGNDSPDHTHTYGRESFTNIAYAAGGSGALVATGGTYDPSTAGASTRHAHTIDVPAFTGTSGASSAVSTGNGPGASTPLDIMPPWLALNCFIKT